MADDAQRYEAQLCFLPLVSDEEAYQSGQQSSAKTYTGVWAVDARGNRRHRSNLKSNASRIKCLTDKTLFEAHERQKLYYDKFVNSTKDEFKEGDLVLLINSRSKPGESKSFKDKLIGPFRVKNKFNDVNYTIENEKTKKQQVAHYNRLKPYRSRPEYLCSLSKPQSRSLSVKPKLNSQTNVDLSRQSQNASVSSLALWMLYSLTSREVSMRSIQQNLTQTVQQVESQRSDERIPGETSTITESVEIVDNVSSDSEQTRDQSIIVTDTQSQSSSDQATILEVQYEESEEDYEENVQPESGESN